MLDCFSRLAEQENEDRRNPRRYKKKKRMDGQNSSNELYSEMSLCMRNINELLILWKQSGFLTDPPVRKKGLPETDPAAPLKRERLHRDERAAADCTAEPETAENFPRQQFSGRFRPRLGTDVYAVAFKRGKAALPEVFAGVQGFGVSVRTGGSQCYSEIAYLPAGTGKNAAGEELIHLHEALDREELRRKEKTDVQFKLKSGNVK